MWASLPEGVPSCHVTHNSAGARVFSKGNFFFFFFFVLRIYELIYPLFKPIPLFYSKREVGRQEGVLAYNNCQGRGSLIDICIITASIAMYMRVNQHT
jgi:hypothetical protein